MGASLLEHFAVLKDPRIDRHKRHELLDILVLVVSAVCSHAKGWEAIEDFGHAKLDWLRQFVPLANGVPHTRQLKPLTHCFLLKTRCGNPM
jgi:hypothetical protein